MVWLRDYSKYGHYYSNHSSLTSVRGEDGGKGQVIVVAGIHTKQPAVTVPWDLDTYLQDGMRLLRILEYEGGKAEDLKVVLEDCYSGVVETLELKEVEKTFKSVTPRRAK